MQRCDELKLQMQEDQAELRRARKIIGDQARKIAAQARKIANMGMERARLLARLEFRKKAR